MWVAIRDITFLIIADSVYNWLYSHSIGCSCGGWNHWSWRPAGYSCLWLCHSSGLISILKMYSCISKHWCTLHTSKTLSARDASHMTHFLKIVSLPVETSSGSRYLELQQTSKGHLLFILQEHLLIHHGGIHKFYCKCTLSACLD